MSLDFVGRRLRFFLVRMVHRVLLSRVVVYAEPETILNHDNDDETIGNGLDRNNGEVTPLESREIQSNKGPTVRSVFEG